MLPSKVIFERSIILDNQNISDLIESSFSEVYSPKHTREELVAELEAMLQSIANKDPQVVFGEDSLYGLIPNKIDIIVDISDLPNLSVIINSKGKILIYTGIIEYKEVQMVGFIDEKYMIANNKVNLWSDYAEIIYIPKESGITIKKMQLIE